LEHDEDPYGYNYKFTYTYISYTRNSLFIYENKGNLEHLAIIIEMIVNIADNPLNVELEMK
jgi:hypothetical protein